MIFEKLSKKITGAPAGALAGAALQKSERLLERRSKALPGAILRSAAPKICLERLVERRSEIFRSA